MNKAAACVSTFAILWLAGLVAALALAQPVQAQGFGIGYGEAQAAPDIGGVRISLRGGAMGSCGVRYDLTPRREPGNLLVIEIAVVPVSGGPGCQFVHVTLNFQVPFANLDDGQYEVVVLHTNPPVPVELHSFTFGMPVATGVPAGDRWSWALLVLGLLALAWRQRRVRAD
jgi:hypothetical protein